jgi:AcrR family transcriptional regulator
MEQKKRAKQRCERRQQIIECALDMIISRGFDSTKIRDIADKLQISTGLFFNYFESKEKLYEELIRIGLSGPEHVLSMNTADLPPLVFFEKMTDSIFEALRENSFTGKMFLLMTQSLRSDATPDSVKKLIAGMDAVLPLLPIIERGQELNQIKKGSPIALAVAYWSAVQGVAESCALQPNLPLPESSWIVDILRLWEQPAL